MKNTLSLVLLVAMGSSGLGCAAFAMPGSQTWFDGHSTGKESLSQRAAFDLKCPAEELEYTPLDKQSQKYLTTGVSGCERQATYVYVDHKWVMNNAAQQE